MTNNDCYKTNLKIKPKGIMIHSTATPGIMAANWFSRWNKSYKAGQINRQACVHAFIDDKEVYQYLPWNHRGWHGGGKANDTHIGLEICEPGGFSYSRGAMIGYDTKKHEAYFRAAWKNTVELCVYLCKEYDLTEKDIIGHVEGYKKGISSNSADPLHWFPKHGESMDSFRANVRDLLSKSDNDTPINIGNLVKITGTKYYNGKTIPDWVKKLNWYVHSINGNYVVLNEDENHKYTIMSPFKTNDLTLVAGAADEYIIYTVVKGDSLWLIAKGYFSDGSRYKEIMELNNLKSNVITIGQKLKIPKL